MQRAQKLQDEKKLIPEIDRAHEVKTYSLASLPAFISSFGWVKSVL